METMGCMGLCQADQHVPEKLSGQEENQGEYLKKYDKKRDSKIDKRYINICAQ